MADEIEKVIMSNENRGRGMKEGWKTTSFGSVCEYHKENGVHKDLPYVGLEQIESGTGHLLETISSDSVLSNSFKFSKGDVLYGRLRPYLKKAIVADFEGCCSTEIFPIRSKEVIPDFIKYWFLSDTITTKINDTSAGCRMPRGNMNEVLKFSFSYPQSIEEQQSIVAHLDASFAEIDALKAKAAEEVANAKAMFDAALREEMTPKEDFPSDKLVNVFNFIDYRGATPTKLSSGIPLVTAKNVKKGYIDYTIKDYISETEYSQRQSRGISHKGDILFTTEAPLGNVALADLEVFSAGQRLITFQQYDSPKYVVENKYYMYYFLSYGFQTTLNKLATGATAQGIKAKILKEVIIPVPPISTQQRIVAKLDTLRSHLTEFEQKYNLIAANCDALKQAILRETFE